MNQALHHANDAVRAGIETIGESLAEVKPKLRGWMHLATAPLALAGGIVLICLSPTATTRIGSALFAASALLLFGVSAIYHTGTWSPRVWTFLRRFDHANIFILIAGTYTPITLILLDGTAARGAAVGGLGGARSSACCSGCSGWTPRAGSTCRSTSASAGRRCSSSPASSTARPAARAPGWRSRSWSSSYWVVPLHVRRRRLRRQAAGPLAAVVRLPRGFPLVHDRRRSSRTTSASRWRRTRFGSPGTLARWPRSS